MTASDIVRKKGQPGVSDRAAFWRFCRYASANAGVRSGGSPVICTIDAHHLDRLLVDQKWRCAVSGIALEVPGERSPFGPSIDRIVPSLGYVPGNVRIVCTIVNFAMSDWGDEPLRKLVQNFGG